MTTISRGQRLVMSPEAMGRRTTPPASGVPDSANGASRPSTPNQTLNVSARWRHGSRPYWAMPRSVIAV